MGKHKGLHLRKPDDKPYPMESHSLTPSYLSTTAAAEVLLSEPSDAEQPLSDSVSEWICNRHIHKDALLLEYSLYVSAYNESLS